MGVNVKAFITHLVPSATLTPEAAPHLAGRSSTGDNLAPSTLIALPWLKGEQHSNAVGLMSLEAPGLWISLVRSKAKPWCVGHCRGEMSGVSLGLESPELGKSRTPAHHHSVLQDGTKGVPRSQSGIREPGALEHVTLGHAALTVLVLVLFLTPARAGHFKPGSEATRSLNDYRRLCTVQGSGVVEP